MSETTFRTIAIILYFAGMLAIGWFAYRKTKDSLDDYMLAGRGLRPSVAALSAGASDMSGWAAHGPAGRDLPLGTRRSLDRDRSHRRRLGELEVRRASAARLHGDRR